MTHGQQERLISIKKPSKEKRHKGVSVEDVRKILKNTSLSDQEIQNTLDSFYLLSKVLIKKFKQQKLANKG